MEFNTSTDNESAVMNSDAPFFNVVHDESKVAASNDEKKGYFQGKDLQGIVDYYDYSDSLTAFTQDPGPVPENTAPMTYNHNQQIQETKEESDKSMISMMKEVNDQLEAALEQSKQSVKRILKELVAFHEVSMTTLNEWKPIRDAEQQEAQRLEELQAEVRGATASFPPCVNTNNPNTIGTGMHHPQKP
jgi:hypothetical protein